MRRLRVCAALALAGGLLGCQPAAPPADSTAAAAPAPAPGPAALAPQVTPSEVEWTTVQEAAGLKAALAKLKGRPLMVNFWATWCPACIKEFPDLVAVAQQYAEQVTFVTVNGDDAKDVETKARPFLAKHGVRQHNLRYETAKETRFIDEFHKPWSGEFPVTFFYKADGSLHQMLQGEQSKAAFVQAVEDLLAAR
ncbi:MAG: TlpA family protein disulfide reductase [Fimbriimonadaceae bacterium]|nr:TlpA family protein disulfide reductase [Fimbriimonadaceae bacterium]